MCGIFGAISSEDVKKDLIEGLSKLEYRGYDSAGLSLITSASKIKRIRCTGKVKELKKLLLKSLSSSFVRTGYGKASLLLLDIYRTLQYKISHIFKEI